MRLNVTIFFICVLVCVYALPNPRSLGEEYLGFSLISRDGWNARQPRSTTTLNTPVDLVIIHHSYQPGACFNTVDCSSAMRNMQNFHQLTNGWEDIGYNFAVGSDGQAYEGRGWTHVGAHAAGWNSRSIGIVLIGNWVSALPPPKQLETTKKLIAAGVALGYISPEYRLIGHRQVRATECPGERLFREISTWDRFTPKVSAGQASSILFSASSLLILIICYTLHLV